MYRSFSPLIYLYTACLIMCCRHNRYKIFPEIDAKGSAMLSDSWKVGSKFFRVEMPAIYKCRFFPRNFKFFYNSFRNYIARSKFTSFIIFIKKSFTFRIDDPGTKTSNSFRDQKERLQAFLIQRRGMKLYKMHISNYCTCPT